MNPISPKQRLNDRGIALLITISIIALMVPLVLELNRMVRSSIMTTGTSRDRSTLEWVAASGIHLGMALLVKDKIDTEIDSVQETWADPEALARGARRCFTASRAGEGQPARRPGRCQGTNARSDLLWQRLSGMFFLRNGHFGACRIWETRYTGTSYPGSG